MWQCMHHYSGDGDVFCDDSGLKHGAEHVTDIVDHFHMFFDKHCKSRMPADTQTSTKLQEVKFMLC